MKRVIIICEGPTEQEFCRDVLAPQLAMKDVYVETPLIKKSNGGIVSWQALKRQIENHLHESNAYVTMLIDYYGIKDELQFPGWKESATERDKEIRLRIVWDKMKADVSNGSRDRFIPYIQLHEFEGLLFSDVSKFSNWYAPNEMDLSSLELVCTEFDNPEMVNNGSETAPSKRLLSAIPKYSKVLDGNCIAIDIGLDAIRMKCPLFNEWVCKLEGLRFD